LIDYLFTSEFATIINKEGRKERGRAEGRKGKEEGRVMVQKELRVSTLMNNRKA